MSEESKQVDLATEVSLQSPAIQKYLARLISNQDEYPYRLDAATVKTTIQILNFMEQSSLIFPEMVHQDAECSWILMQDWHFFLIVDGISVIMSGKDHIIVYDDSHPCNVETSWEDLKEKLLCHLVQQPVLPQ